MGDSASAYYDALAEEEYRRDKEKASKLAKNTNSVTFYKKMEQLDRDQANWSLTERQREQLEGLINLYFFGNGRSVA